MLWIAFKLVILSYGKQLVIWVFLEKFVVNCFQISNFVLWQTAMQEKHITMIMLWIAFKLVILSYGKQHRQVGKVLRSVVNCFQISNFVLWQTAFRFGYWEENQLWIAFKLVILSYGKQPMTRIIEYITRCELLSN